MAFSRWYPADGCTGSKPGSKALMAVLLDEYDGQNWGIYNCRPPSLHAEGRALDIGISREEGRKLRRDLLRADPSQLGISSIIHEQTIWSRNNPSGSKMADRGSITANHFDHVHIGLTRSAAENLTKSKVRRVLGVSSGSSYESYRGGAVLGSRTLRKGSAGDDVKDLQRILNAWYPNRTALKRDGYYGPKTEAAVKYLQERASITVDGIAGRQTFGVLNVS